MTLQTSHSKYCFFFLTVQQTFILILLWHYFFFVAMLGHFPSKTKCFNDWNATSKSNYLGLCMFNGKNDCAIIDSRMTELTRDNA